jgi:cell division septal protein FtsQ
MRRYKVIISFILILGITFFSIILSGFWKEKNTIKSVELTGNTTLSKDEIFDYAKLSDSLIKSNVLTLDMIETRISKHPNIKKANVSRESSAIKIEISEKDPFAVAYNGKSMFLIDDQLNLYNIKKENTNLDLPVISGLSQGMDINSYSVDDLRNLKIARYIISQAIKIDRVLYNFISEIDFSDSSCIVIYSSEDATPIYFIDYSTSLTNTQANISKVIDISNIELKNSINQKLVYLYDFLKQILVYKSRNSFAYVDMRYQDLIVVKNNGLSTIE